MVFQIEDECGEQNDVYRMMRKGCFHLEKVMAVESSVSVKVLVEKKN